MESAFSIKLWRNLFLVKLQGLPINGSERVREGVLWRSMLLASGCESLFLVTFQEITTNSTEKACAGICFYLQAVTELFLINLHVFTITGSEGVCDRVCVWLHALTESDCNKGSGHYYKRRWEILWRSLWRSLI